MLTKEECKKELENSRFFEVVIRNENGNVEYYKNFENTSIFKLLEQLIEEHFYIPPIITALKIYSDSTFQKFTKKELIEYIHTIYHNWKNACIVNERVIKMNYKLQSEIDEFKNQLVEFNSSETRDNPPLKFEELKEGEWYWDNKKKRYFKIFELDVPNKEIIAFDYWGLGFEENRFYRKEVDV